MTLLAQLARAKINLTLRVHGRRVDGYHELESLVVFADTGDRLTLDADAPSGFSISGPTATAIDGPNLVERVLMVLRASAPDLQPGHFHLEKQLPVAAGIGGGSADAAAAIQLLEQRFAGNAAVAALAADAARLGADIPACLVSRALVMRGIGERLRPLRRFAPIPAVLVNPRVPLATAHVFRALAAPPTPPVEGPLEWPEELAVPEAIELVLNRPNDLEPVARRLQPAIEPVLGALRGLPGCRLVRMSGSGPTCFGLFEDRRDAELGAKALARDQPQWWSTATTLS